MTTTTDDVLAKLGLQTRMNPRDYLFPAIGIFGFGILVGAGIVVMSQPRMREQLRERLRRGANKMREMKDDAAEKLEDAKEQLKERMGGNGKHLAKDKDYQGLTRDQLLERAKSMNVPTRPDMTKSDLIEAMSR